MGAALEPFARLIAGEDTRIDLARACLLIAQDAYPELDIERYMGEIERMATQLRARLPQTCGAEERVVALNQSAESASPASTRSCAASSTRARMGIVKR